MSERRVTRHSMRRAAYGEGSTDQDKVMARQKVLRQELLKDLQEQYKGGDTIDDQNLKNAQKMASINCFRETSEFPTSVRSLQCSVDQGRCVVFIPFQGYVIPVHVSTIRNAVFYEDTTDSTSIKKILRLTFHVPGASMTDVLLPEINDARSFFFREISIRSDRDGHLQDIARQITDIHKRLKGQDSQQPVAPTTQLQMNRSPTKITLRSLMVRYTGCPTRRPIGTLEAHVNGVRYMGSGSRDVIDIIYSNVEHVIFQPCKSDMHTYIHFHLKNPIMINSKRQKDVQFYKEIGQLVDDLDSRRQRGRDPDEIAEEAKELRMKQLTNTEFKKFVEAMQGFSSSFDLRAEAPIRKLAFRGVPKNENVEIMPTARAICHLTSWPPFIVSLKEVQVIVLERVVHGLRNFDMVIIFKDYSRKQESINALDMSKIDMIRKWLTESDIVWYESKVPLYWPKILKTLKLDPSGFYAQGGFGAFMADGDDDVNSEGSGGISSDDEDDAAFEDDPNMSSSEYDSDSTSLADSEAETEESDDTGGGRGSDSDDSDGSSQSKEEEGLDWDEMDKITRNEERKRRETPAASGGMNNKRPKK